VRRAATLNGTADFVSGLAVSPRGQKLWVSCASSLPCASLVSSITIGHIPFGKLSLCSIILDVNYGKTRIITYATSLSFVRTELSDFLEAYLVFISNYICMVCKKYKETKDTVNIYTATIINDITYLYPNRNAAAAHGDAGLAGKSVSSV
jgi:hypothetical protein